MNKRRVLRRRKRRLSRLCKKIILLTTIVFIGYFGYKIFNEVQDIKESKKNYESLVEEANTLKEEEIALANRNHEGLTRNEIEEIARNKFHLIYPNEIILVPEK